ncbi:MAG: DUF4231 domain-containing protein [Candidatus Bathyarchaeia archaeon]
MEEHHYPALYQQSDSLALNARRKYFHLTIVKILILIIVAIITSIAWVQQPSLRTQATIVLTILLVLSISLTSIMSYRRFDRIWFVSRAIAESVKAETWKFMMKAGQYQGISANSEAKNRFFDSLKQILNQQSEIVLHLNPNFQEMEQITENMERIKNETFENRLNYYIQNRIRDQMLWYGKKAIWNRTQEYRWFVITWILEILAVVVAVLMIVQPEGIVNPVSLIMATGAGVLSWINARSYSEPAQSYACVAQQLALLEGRAKNVSNENELATIVLDVEETIRKEHSIWVARLL